MNTEDLTCTCFIPEIPSGSFRRGDRRLKREPRWPLSPKRWASVIRTEQQGIRVSDIDNHSTVCPLWGLTVFQVPSQVLPCVSHLTNITEAMIMVFPQLGVCLLRGRGSPGCTTLTALTSVCLAVAHLCLTLQELH